MSRTFKVDSIFALTEATDHFKSGQVFARIGSEFYVYVGYEGDWPQTNLSPKVWPLELYRDYWNFFCDIRLRCSRAPYYRQVFKAKRHLINGQAFSVDT